MLVSREEINGICKYATITSEVTPIKNYRQLLDDSIAIAERLITDTTKWGQDEVNNILDWIEVLPTGFDYLILTHIIVNLAPNGNAMQFSSDNSPRAFELARKIVTRQKKEV